MTEDDFLRTTRASYDAVAGDYAERFRDELTAKPLDRAMLAGFAELVRAAGGGPVADVGCGTGRVTAHLSGLGLSVFGIDLSPQMIAAARQAHPGLRFDVGSMLALDVPDGVLGGVLAWYSTIHIPPDAATGGLRRVPPGAGPGRLRAAWVPGRRGDAAPDGGAGSGDLARLPPAAAGHVAGLLAQAGLVVRGPVAA